MIEEEKPIDPFDYVSVPIQPAYTVRAKLNWHKEEREMSNLPTDAEVEALADEPDFIEGLQGFASMCDSGAIDKHDGPMLARKFRDAAFVISMLQKLRDELRAAPAVAPSADEAYNAGLEMGARVADHAGSWRIATAIRASKRDRAEARAESALRVMREALTKAEKALDAAEVVIDADAEVEAFNLVQDTRLIARAALAQNKEEGR